MEMPPRSGPAPPTSRGTLGLLRLVVLGLVLALSVPVTPLEAPPGIIFSIVLASVTAVAVALWRPFWGAVLLAVAVVPATLVDIFGYQLAALVIVAGLVTTFEPWRRTVLALALLAAAVALPRLGGGLTLSVVWTLTTLGVGVLVGLLARPTALRARNAAGRIAALRREQVRVRAEERALLADELSSLLDHEMREAAVALAAGPVDAEPATLRAMLRRAATTASDSLMRLRCLVVILRGEVVPGGNPAADPVTMLELLEEVLVGHGVQVTVDVERPGNGAPTSLALMHDVLRELTAVLPAQVAPDSTVDLSLAGAGEVTLTVAARVSGVVPVPAPGLVSRVSAAGGRLESAQKGDAFELLLVLPWAGAEAARKTPPVRARLDLRRLGRLASIPLAAGALLLAVGGALRPDSGVWWGLSLAVLALAVLPRSRWGALAIAGAALALYGFGGLPSDAGLVVAVVVASAIAATLGTTVAAAALVVSAIYLGARPLTSAGPENLTLAILMSLTGLSVGLTGSYLLALRDAQLTQLTRLAEQSDRVRDDERRLLAGELHDVVAHQLSLITLTVSARADSEDREALARTREVTLSALRSAQTDLSMLLGVLRRSPDERAGVLLEPTAVADGLRPAVEKTGRRLLTDIDPGVNDADASTISTLNRILREASTNLMRYAERGSTARLCVQVTGEDVDVVVSSPLAERTPSDALSTGSGLLGLRERVLLTGGTFSAGREGREWVVRARLRRSSVEVPRNGPPEPDDWPTMLKGIFARHDGWLSASSTPSS